MKTFEELGVSPEIRRAIEEMGYENPMPVQEEVIPYLLGENNDVVALAQTGTGKTAAFGLPLLQQIDVKNRIPQSLILCPTRELCLQIAGDLNDYSKYIDGLKVLPVYGGSSIDSQIRSLKRGVHIIVATPGRLLDLMERKTVSLSTIRNVVMDEADEMLNMGFREDIETILEGVPEDRQTVLFSATMPQAILDITKKFQKNAEIVKVTKKELTVPNIEQYYYEVKPKSKEEVLARLLDIYSPKLSVVFCNTKKQVDILVNGLLGRGYFAAGLHGDMKQQQRDRVMQGFRSGKTDILVATDVAARGIDVDEVEAVFNYDLPQDDEYYVHRIGRTGRAGREGRSFSFVSGKEVYKLKEIQRYCKTKIYAQKVPSLNDVESTKIENILGEIDNIIETEDLTKYLQAIENKVNESDYTAMDMAAAFLKLSSGQNEAGPEDIEFGDTGAEEAGMVRLFINIGKKNKAKPGDIVGAIAGESGIPGKLIGSIDMYDKYTFVEVPKEYAREVLGAMDHAKIKGKNVAVEPANQK